jgi:hypothetical protein
MINWLRRKWLRYNMPTRELRAINEMLIKAGRRCAYDLAHAASYISTQGDPTDTSFYEIFQERSDHWKGVFNPTNVGKDYYNAAQVEHARLEREIVRLKQVCQAAGIDYRDPERYPF